MNGAALNLRAPSCASPLRMTVSPSEDCPTMQTTNPTPTPAPETEHSPQDRETILRVLEEYRTLLYEPLPAAEVNERVLRAKIDALLDRLNQLRRG